MSGKLQIAAENPDTALLLCDVIFVQDRNDAGERIRRNVRRDSQFVLRNAAAVQPACAEAEPHAEYDSISSCRVSAEQPRPRLRQANITADSVTRQKSS